MVRRQASELGPPSRLNDTARRAALRCPTVIAAGCQLPVRAGTQASGAGLLEPLERDRGSGFRPSATVAIGLAQVPQTESRTRGTPRVSSYGPRTQRSSSGRKAPRIYPQAPQRRPRGATHTQAEGTPRPPPFAASPGADSGRREQRRRRISTGVGGASTITVAARTCGTTRGLDAGLAKFGSHAVVDSTHEAPPNRPASLAVHGNGSRTARVHCCAGCPASPVTRRTPVTPARHAGRRL